MYVKGFIKINVKVKSVILDGEICAWHKDENRIVQKGDKYDIRNIKADNQKYQQCLIIYDICYLNGKILTPLPLKVHFKLYNSTFRWLCDKLD